jgi:hypothetical protein
MIIPCLDNLVRHARRRRRRTDNAAAAADSA